LFSFPVIQPIEEVLLRICLLPFFVICPEVRAIPVLDFTPNVSLRGAAGSCGLKRLTIHHFEKIL
jgi:hypothetical protein